MHFQRVLEYIDLYYDMGLLSMMLFFLRTVLPIYLIDSLKKVYDLLKKKIPYSDAIVFLGDMEYDINDDNR